MEKVLIDNQSIAADFAQHLSSLDNKRILFTGAFGAGKSYFLKQFFEEHPKYLKVNLFPVDYPVAANEDILEHIKFDILNFLLDEYGDDLEVSAQDFSVLLIVQLFMMHKLEYFNLAQKFVKFFDPASALLMDSVSGAKHVMEKFENYRDEISSNASDSAGAYLAAARQTKGSIREQDAITELIRTFLQRLKDKYPGFPTLLVIDDLDRLDPDHVFRIFNIFTAHYDSQQEKNKFNFDRIVLVCDIDTLRHLFHHRFGKHANFNGYIDKFYSTRPFYFNNKKFLNEKIDELLSGKYKLVQDGSSDRQNIGYLNHFGRRTSFFEAFTGLLVRLIEQGQLKIRNFDRFPVFYLKPAQIKVAPRQTHDANTFQFLVLISLLKQFFVGLHELRASIEVLMENYNSIYKTDIGEFFNEDEIDHQLIAMSLPFLVDDRIAFKRRKKEIAVAPISLTTEYNQEIFVFYELSDRLEYWDAGIFYQGCKSNQEEPAYLQRPNPYLFLLTAFDVCRAKGFIE